MQMLEEIPATTDWRTFYGFVSSPADATLARQRARRCVEEEWKLNPQAAEDVELIVSELASNVVRHANTGERDMFRVHIFRSPGLLRIECHDKTWNPLMLQDVSDQDEAGRGLLLVNMLADRSGTQLHPGGKCVWVEKDLTDPGEG